MKKAAILFLVLTACAPSPAAVGIQESVTVTGPVEYVSSSSVDNAPLMLRDIAYIKDQRLTPPACFGFVYWGYSSVMASVPCDSIPAGLIVAVRK